MAFNLLDANAARVKMENEKMVVAAMVLSESGDISILDKSSDSHGHLSFMTFARREVHDDHLIQAQHYIAGASGAVDFLIAGGSPLESHLIFAITADKAARLQFYEDVTVSAEGTAILIARLNRESARVTQASIKVGPTVTDLGTELPGDFNGGGGLGAGSSGGQAGRPGTEYLLLQDILYLLRVTVPADTVLSTYFQWYEVSYA